MIGIGATLFKVANKARGFSPSSLFSSGEAGVWYDPSDLTTMFQDDTSAAPAVIGQPVGTMLDKSQGLKLGSELITNGDFAADSNWTKGTGWSIANGVGVADNVTGQNLRQNGVALAANKVYSVTFTILSISAGSVLGRFGGTPAVDSASFTEAGTYTFFLRANSTNTSFMLRGSSGFTGTVDNVTVKEVLGSHATATDTKRPILARHPEGGVRNLLSYTQEFDDDYWTKTGPTTVIANNAVAPDGTTTADKLTYAQQYTTIKSPADLVTTAGVTATVSVWLKNVDGNTALRLRGSISGSTYLETITITNEWARYTATFTHNGTNDIGFVLQDGNVGNFGSLLIWGAQVELGSTATQYQHVTDDLRYDITEPFGANSLNYLSFDGVSDGMFINGLTSSSTPITAWFGYSATNTESSAFKYLIDIQTGRTILAASTSIAGNIGYSDGAFSGFTADANALKVLTYDLVEDNAKMRVDGTQEYSDTTYDQLAIGGQISLFQNNVASGAFLAGNLYSCILRAAESTDKEIASTESYVAKKTGINL